MDTGLRRLRYFRTLAAELNFRRAARRLNITQPALSRAIVQLEAQVGARLFERSNRQVRLTLAGGTFAQGCDRVLDTLDDTVEQTLRVDRGLAGTLSVGYTDTAIAGRLPDIVEAFRTDTPDVRIHLVQADLTRQAALLGAGDLDVGIVTGPVGRPGFDTVNVQSDRLVAILPTAHPLAGRDRIGLADLAASSFVLGDLDKWEVYNLHLFRHCDRIGFRPRIVQTAPESRAIIGLVSCGLGVSVLPESLARAMDVRVVAIPLNDVAEPLLTQAAWRRGDVPPALTRLIGHLRGYATA